MFMVFSHCLWVWKGRTDISNYDTNNTCLDEAPFGRADDDNGPGSEPSPHDNKRYVSTFITSRRRSPAAIGKPSFPRFKGYYLPRRRVQVRAETVGLARRRSPWCEDVREIRRHLHQSPETEDWLEPPRVSVDGLLRHPYAVESSLSYNMIEQTTRAEAASGPDGDDNGPGSEPPPHDRFHYV
ncbi:hypothetical protein THAOC_17439 [Thalassiosira oceanica]|uniref:Uncharacterized protein n=1 Tax=Thalassiosira oceanica TaxID=159749 RepID=K0SUM1_THAOC|nr:hypothetical protein THAOC_17439 [Thalassiosira oceanica]|eukprot:EJK61977.1 hypothetical protein THAOC_17439 [Thalassiosira oceanica]